MINMFLGKTFPKENREVIQLFGENDVQPGVQEIHIEIVGQNATQETLPFQVHDVTSLKEYFITALKQEPPPVEQLKCFCCGEKYLCFKALYNHAQSKHKDFASHPLKCFMCHQLFVFIEEYHGHLISDHKICNPDAVCDVCLILLPDCEALRDHGSCHQANYACKNCSEKFFSQDQVALHQQYHNCGKKLLCDICGITFQSKFLLGLHSLRHIQIECPFAVNNNCSSLNSEVELLGHFKQNHPHDDTILIKLIESYDKEETCLDELLQSAKQDGSRTTRNGKGLDFKSWLSKIRLRQNSECTTCSIKLTSVFQLWIHFLKIHPNSKICPMCKKKFKETTNILLHLGSESCKANQEPTTILTCLQCDVTFHQREELLNHQLTHIKPLQCSHCDSSFQKKSELRRHLQDYDLPLFLKVPEPVFICPVCSSRWACMTNLRRHIRTHVSDKPFQCEHCGASFKRQQALKAHAANAHSGQSHACPHCDNTCRSKQALFLHVCRVHVRLRRFVCGLCAKPWPQNQDLRRHLSKSHHLNYPPLTKSLASSSKDVHVIPPLENLAPQDPLRTKIAEVIAEEKNKLRSLYSEFGADSATLEGTILEDSVREQSDLPSTESKATQESNKIYLSCDSCDFRCQDFNVWIEHTMGHHQIAPSIPLEIVNVPIVPVEPIFVSPVIPTTTINYGTLVTVVPTPNLTINEPFPIIQQPIIVPQPLDHLVLPTEILNEGTEIIESEKKDCETDCGELININGMFVRIEHYDGDISELISKSTISFENTAINETGAEDKPVEKLTEDADDNESVSTDQSNLTDEINENIDDIVKLANEGSGVEIDPNELIRLPETTDVQSATEKAAIWSCQQCGKIVSSDRALQRHIRSHKGDRPFTCIVCDKAFTEKYNLKTHMLSHTQERPYSCPTCGKKMRYAKEYMDHEKKHQGIKNYSCSICGCSFVRKRELTRHQNTHSAEKKYQCSICLKYFPRLDSLKLHIPQIHGEFPCSSCKKRFSSHYQLDQHQRTHSKPPPSKKRFICSTCGKTFARNSGLKAHLQLHANNKAHIVCYACPRKFCSMGAMLTHLVNFHKKWRDELAEENRGIVENCRISVQTEDATEEVNTLNIQGFFEVNDPNDSCIAP